MQGSGYDFGRRGRIAVDEHGQRQVGEYGFRVGAERLFRILRTPFGAQHLRALGDEHPQNLDRLLHDAAAIRAVVENEPFQVAFPAQPFDGRTHLLVAPFCEIAVADVADPVGGPSDVGHARDGDAFAADRRRLLRAVEVFDGHPDLAPRFAFEARGDLFGGESLGVLAVDREDLVADFQPGLVRRRTFIRLGDAHVVLLLADERPDAAVLARGEQFEILHPLFGNVLRVGVQVVDHACGGPLHQLVGVYRIDVVERQLAHHVDGDLHVASQPEVVAGCEGQGSCGGDERVTVFSNHCASCVCTNRGGIAPGRRRGGCRRARSIVRTVKLLFRLRPAA